MNHASAVIRTRVKLVETSVQKDKGSMTDRERTRRLQRRKRRERDSAQKMEMQLVSYSTRTLKKIKILPYLILEAEISVTLDLV